MPKDYPVQEVIDQVNQYRELFPDMIAYQKWTCSHCGARQTMIEPNSFYAAGVCEECEQTTVIENCNWLAAFSTQRTK